MINKNKTQTVKPKVQFSSRIENPTRSLKDFAELWLRCSIIRILNCQSYFENAVCPENNVGYASKNCQKVKDEKDTPTNDLIPISFNSICV